MINIDNCEEYYNEVRTIAEAASLGKEFENMERMLKESKSTYELFKSDKPLSFGCRVLNPKNEFIQTCLIEFKPAKKVAGGKYTNPHWDITTGDENGL